MSELKSIFSSEVKYDITSDKSILIKEICLKDIPEALEIASKIKFETNNLIEMLKGAFSKDHNLASKLFLITTDLKKEEIEKLNAAACILIATKVIEVNADFFAQQVVPALKGLLEKSKSLAGTIKSKS